MSTDNIWERLLGGASRHGSIRFHDGAGVVSWADMASRARHLLPRMRKLGIGPGSNVAAILTNNPAGVAGVAAVWFSGAAVASLPLPPRGMSVEEYTAQLGRIRDQLGSTVVLADAETVSLLPESAVDQLGVRTWESLEGATSGEPTPPGPDDIAVIQYSSGSTGAPSGCRIATRAIEAQVALIMNMMSATPGAERPASWVPISHDMGLFGTLATSWVNDFSLLLMDPSRFGRAPRSWFDTLASFGATLSVGTNTGLALATRAGRRAAPPEGHLRDLRVVILGAERTEWATMLDAVSVYGPAGLRMEAFMPAYGLAEGTLAVTGTPADAAPEFIDVDGDALSEGRIERSDDPGAVRLVSAGVPCEGVELVGANGDLDELRFTSPSMFSGYHADPEKTERKLRDGVLHTGDLGFVAGGHLYPVGRQDDMISIEGRNIFAREIELAVDRLDDVRTGCTSLVRSLSDNSVALLLEASSPEGDLSALSIEASSVVLKRSGISVDRCIIVGRGSIPKTPSGKIQRHRCVQLLASGTLEVLHEHVVRER